MADKKMSIPSEPPPSYEKSTSPVPPGNTMSRGPPASPRGPRLPLPLDVPVLNMLKGKRVILASASPRRKQLLAQIGLTQLEIIPSSFAEDLPKSMGATDYVHQTATQKALAVYRAEINNVQKGEPALVIAADTVVVGHFGEILEKPRNEKDHIGMLTLLRDSGPHRVITAVVCIAPLESAQDPGYAMESAVEETVVKFDTKMTDATILAYVRTREGADKAGGYGIQGIGSLLVERIEGTFDNVVGLPLRATLQTIEKVLIQQQGDEDDEFGAGEDGDGGGKGGDGSNPTLFSGFWNRAT